MVMSSHGTEVVQDSQPTILPMEDVKPFGEKEIDSDLEVDSHAMGM